MLRQQTVWLIHQKNLLYMPHLEYLFGPFITDVFPARLNRFSLLEILSSNFKYLQCICSCVNKKEDVEHSILKWKPSIEASERFNVRESVVSVRPFGNHSTENVKKVTLFLLITSVYKGSAIYDNNHA